MSADQTSANLAEAPLSAEQLVFWLASLEGATDSFLTLSLGYRLYGPLNVDAFRTALLRLQEEQDVLHSRVRHGAEGVYCVRTDPAGLDFRDLRRFSLGDAERRAHAISTFETARPFDLQAESFARFRLLRLRDDEYVFLVTVHHIAFDADSVAILERRLSALYADALADRPPPATTPAGRYGAYAARQRRTPLTPQGLAYWSPLLSRPAPPGLSWPDLDGAAEAPDANAGDAIWSELGSEAWQAAAALVHRTGATPHIVLLSAFIEACIELCGVPDGQPIEVGVPTSLRWEQQWQDVIGPFVHTLPVRATAGPAPDLIRRIAEIRATTVEMLDHLKVPLARVVQLVRPEPVAALPRPRVAFQYLDPGGPELTLPGVEVDGYPRPRQGVPPFDLSLVVYQTDHVPRVRFLIDPRSGATTRAATRLLASFEHTLLRQATVAR